MADILKEGEGEMTKLTFLALWDDQCKDKLLGLVYGVPWSKGDGVLGRAEAILEKKAKEGMAAEDRTAIAETEGARAVRRLLEKRNAKEAEAILERIAGEMAQSESAASSSGPEVQGSYLQTVDADPYENVPVADTVSQYRAHDEKAAVRKDESRCSEPKHPSQAV